jgi:hypothetical protein
LRNAFRCVEDTNEQHRLFFVKKEKKYYNNKYDKNDSVLPGKYMAMDATQ